MNPLFENILISFVTGLMASASLIQTSTGTERDWIVIGSAGIIAFGGSLINGLRQLQKTPVPQKDPSA